MALSMALFFILGSVVVTDQFGALEQKDATVSVSRVEDAIAQQLDSYDNALVGWSDWDDTYAWAQDRNPDFVATNLGDSVFTQTGANVLVFIDQGGQVIWAKHADLGTGAVTDGLPAGLDAYVSSGAKLIRHPDVSAPVKGIVNLPAGPMLIVSRAILTSDASGSSHGTAILGRYLDGTVVAQLSGLTHLELSVVPLIGGLPQAGAPADVGSNFSRLQSTEPVAIPLNDRRIEGYASLEDLNGSPAVVLRVDMARDVFAQGQQTIGILLGLLAIMALVIVVIVFMLIDRMVVRGLGSLTGVVDRLARGDVTVIVPETNRRDEIGAVAHAFERMVDYLRTGAAAADMVSTGDLTCEMRRSSDDDVLALALDRMVQSLRVLVGQASDAAEQVDGVAKGVSVSANELSEATGHVALNVASVSDGTRDQRAKVVEILDALMAVNVRVSEVRTGGQAIDARIAAADAALVDMLEAIESATAAAAEVEVVSTSAATAAANGAASVRESVAGMERIHDVVQTAATKVSELGAKGSEIGAIVETIDDIAEQTNLLALNAAIEAARAGEQGKGFAVVADEVRKLAERSSNATKEIAALISQVMQGTAEAVAAMDAGAAEVEQGSELTRRGGAAIEELASAVAATRSSAELIGGRIAKMAGSSEGVVAAIREIDRIARENGVSTEAMLTGASAVIGELDDVESVAAATALHAESLGAAAEAMNRQAQTLADSAVVLVRTSGALTLSTAAFRMPGQADGPREAAADSDSMADPPRLRVA